VQGAAPRIDGVLDDPAWAAAPIARNFVQIRPDEGRPASEPSEVRVLYGEHALYIAFKAYDSDPSAVVGQLTRRDQDSFSDRVHVLVDSYNDRRTAFHFAVNPRGVKQDYYRFEDTELDAGWDPVWDVATHVDADGWTAEFEIPYSQLRFSAAERQTWGIQFMRDVARKNETSMWSPVSGQDNAVVSRFGYLEGLEGLSTPRRLELSPYTVLRLTRAPGDERDPFYARNDRFGTMGLDLKYGVTSNLTLDVTVNPDFGQVEADPAQVNLTAFETFFGERRPFFIEGQNIFSFGIGLGDGDGGQESLFYSRRIGRAPQGFANPQGGYVDREENTTILTAAKLSGKTESGWSIGLLHAATAREDARIQTGDGQRLEQMIEPLTNYGVLRVQRDFRDGRSALGLIGTGVVRGADDADALALHRRAFTGGLDFRHRFGGDRYQLSGYLIGSRVDGSAEAIARTQRAPGRYLQRPGQDYLTYDPTRTSLEGFTANVGFSKIAGGFWRFGTGVQTRSPEFETNDIGFLRDVDYTLNWVWVGYNHFLPTRHLRRWNLNFNAWHSYNYGGTRTSLGGNVNGSFQLSNYWGGWFGYGHDGGVTSRTLLRGGPEILTEGAHNGWFGFFSDGRKPVQVNWGAFFSIRPESDSWSWNTGPNVSFRPSGRATVSLGTFYNRRVDDRQWVRRVDLAEPHYVFGRIDQTTVGITGRVDFAFTPDLSLQLYAQPFVSSARYESFKQVADPLADSYADRFVPVRTTKTDAGYEADLDGDGTAEFLPVPDFSFKQFRSNAVLRWEYRPGSTLFIVWSQSRDRFTRGHGAGGFDLGPDLGNLFDTVPTNVFMVKLSYWLNP